MMPTGKTKAWIKLDVNQSDLIQGDDGYIDGYVIGRDNRPYAVFVRFSDGLIDMVPLNSVMASEKETG